MSPIPTEEERRMASFDSYSVDERTLVDHNGSDDGEGYSNARPSSEVSEGDHDILESEDERERLLTSQEGGSGLFSGKKGVKIGKREQKKPSADKQRQRMTGQNEEMSALMYEMEEGVGMSNSNLSRHSSDADEQRLLATTTQRKTRRKTFWRRTAIYGAIVLFFIILLAVAYRLSAPSYKIQAHEKMTWNGTSFFAPTTILISLDGFRADFLQRGLTPTLNKFIEDGISPQYMLPSFPSVTFPNHYTMATGLYPEAHGIVSNKFWDVSLQKEFHYTHPDAMEPFWWGGEPLWVTAERQNVRAAVHMWPGSEAHIGHIEPAYVDKYNGSEVLELKVDRVLELLDIPGPLDAAAKDNQPRPQLIAAYVPDVDGDGHQYGPNSTEIRSTIQNADSMLGSILAGLEERNLTGIVNVVVVSDHGMATTDVERLIQLDDLIDPNELSHIDGWPLYGLRPKNPSDLDRLHKQLVENAKKYGDNLEVYLRDKDMPERYHFSNNERIAPLWIVPKAGWAIVQKSEFNIEEAKKNGEVYHPRGLHGYDHEHPLMRAIFIARGPAFPHKPNSRMQPFQNIELYNIICDSIDINPAPNNGTLRLPLKPIGLHDDPEVSPIEVPADPVETPSASNSSLLATSTLPSLASLVSSATGLEDAMSSIGDSRPVLSIATPTSTAPPEASSGAAKEKESWWQWLTHKADGIEEWVNGFVHTHVPDAQNGEQDPPA